MTSLVKQLFKPTNRDLLKRIGFTILVLAIFIIGTTIQVIIGVTTYGISMLILKDETLKYVICEIKSKLLKRRL